MTGCLIIDQTQSVRHDLTERVHFSFSRLDCHLVEMPVLTRTTLLELTFLELLNTSSQTVGAKLSYLKVSNSKMPITCVTIESSLFQKCKTEENSFDTSLHWKHWTFWDIHCVLVFI